jgi:hypothetical protein
MSNAATTKQKFEEAWEEEFHQLEKLGWSLPMDRARAFHAQVAVLRGFIKEAVQFAYPDPTTSLIKEGDPRI